MNESDGICIYLASSWRNLRYPYVLRRLREEGFNVYDFQNEEASFRWEMVDPDWWGWRAEELRAGLEHPLVRRAFEADRQAIIDCDAFVLLLPCGASAHSEFGYAAGIGRHTVVILADRDGQGDAEVMYRFAGHVCVTVDEAVEALKGLTSGPGG